MLDAPTSYFFDDMSQDTMKSSPRCVSRAGEALDGYGDQLHNPMDWHETF